MEEQTVIDTNSSAKTQPSMSTEDQSTKTVACVTQQIVSNKTKGTNLKSTKNIDNGPILPVHSIKDLKCKLQNHSTFKTDLSQDDEEGNLKTFDEAQVLDSIMKDYKTRYFDKKQTVKDHVNRLIFHSARKHEVGDYVRTSILDWTAITENPNKPNIVEYFSQTIDNEFHIFVIANIKIQKISDMPNFVAIDWYFSPANDINHRRTFANSLSKIETSIKDSDSKKWFYMDAEEFIKIIHS